MSKGSEKTDLEDLGGVGAFVDTGGSRRKTKRIHQASEGDEQLHDEVEERLEELVFGKQPFQRGAGGLLDWSDSEEEVELV